jgi:large subunit ribosomal protein L30
MAENRLKLQLVRSVYGRLKAHRDCVRGLGLRRMHQVAEVEDTPATRGMLNKVQYMVRVLEDG